MPDTKAVDALKGSDHAPQLRSEHDALDPFVQTPEVEPLGKNPIIVCITILSVICAPRHLVCAHGRNGVQDIGLQLLDFGGTE